MSKELKIVQQSIGSYILKFEGGGELPKELTGMYNRRKYAQIAIDAYRLRKSNEDEKKEVTNGKQRHRDKDTSARS